MSSGFFGGLGVQGLRVEGFRVAADRMQKGFRAWQAEGPAVAECSLAHNPSPCCKRAWLQSQFRGL